MGMQQLDGSSYYFESDGKLVRSQTVLIDGVTYRAADDGKLSTNTTPVMGKSQATVAQMAAYIRSVNPNVAQSVLDMIPLLSQRGARQRACVGTLPLRSPAWRPETSPSVALP